MRWFIKIFAVLFVIGIIASILDWMFFSSGDTGREPLPEGAVNETSYYTDELHWIENERELLKGMETFYDKTGVQPHLVITDNVEGNTAPSLADVEQYTQSLYQELFTDEAHLLLVFLENESQEYMTYYVVGSQAESVIDAEAGDMLLDSIDHYYVEEDMTDAAFFSHSFERAADQIMEKTESSLSTASTIIAIILLSAGYGGYKWWKRKREKEELEKQRMEEVLKQPLPTFGASEAEELAKKYQDTNDN
nr:TPM domain-containing protein [Evansella caseinilytica]